MQIDVKCFASLAEAVGFSEKRVTLADGATAADAWREATGQDAVPERTLCAVNLSYATPDVALSEGDEVGFFPPVTGGQDPVRVSVDEAVFSPWAMVAAYEESRGPALHSGASQVFVGTMRDANEGDRVSTMTLSHYPGMTEKHLHAIGTEALERYRLHEVLIHHRVGTIHPGEAIVLVAVWAGHRAEAFEGCRLIMEDLKSRAPFWKKEQTTDGERWVEKNTSGVFEPQP